MQSPTVSFLAVLVLLFSHFISLASSATLTIGTQPALAVGGSSFATQPVVNILDDSGNIYSSFTGSVYATLQDSPSGFEQLWFNGTSTNTLNAVSVADGKAKFSGLTLNEVGQGYILRFIGLDSLGVPFAYVDSTTFSVTTGAAYQISITTYPGTATGSAGYHWTVTSSTPLKKADAR